MKKEKQQRRPVQSKTFTSTIVRDGSMCFIPLTFDPRDVFGRVRAPVKVTVNGYTYQSTIAAMGGPACIPLRKSNREAAGLEGGETIDVTLALDATPRVVRPPSEFVRVLKASPPAWERWQELSYTHQREYLEAILEAKRPETRARRMAAAVRQIRLRRERRRPLRGHA
jgi:bacteriocin resistance YdeI/OmpD-like protein/uncharacterized protein DUF1905